MCLGVCFSHYLTTSVKDNFEKKPDLSKVIFVSSVLSVPNHFVNQVNKLLSNFIWNHKSPKVKRLTVNGKIKHGGGGNMPGIKIVNKSLKADWVKCFFTSETQSWKTIPLSLLHAAGDSFLV